MPLPAAPSSDGTPSGVPSLFESSDPPKPTQPCSANICPAGHEWQPKLVVTSCPGCKSPVVAVRMDNCPICNEPVRSLRLRQDHVPIAPGGHAQAGISPICCGAASLSECVTIELDRQHAATEEAGHIERTVPTKI